MRNLIFLLHQVQPLGNDGIILVLVLADLEQDFDHILHTLAYGPFVEHGTESFVQDVVRFWVVLREESTDLAHEADGDFDAVVCRSFEKKHEDVERDDFVGDRLVHEVCDETGGCVADDLRNRLCLSVSSFK